MTRYTDLVIKATKEFETAYLSADVEEIELSYEVETNLDNDGGVYFERLSTAYEYMSDIIGKQIDTEFFECEDFEKIDYIHIIMHFENIERDNFEVIAFERINDTNFIEK